jgi:hypothetical protein
VQTSLVARDPDYDVVRYWYRWWSGTKLLRTVTSAGLTDVLVRDAARPGQAVRCEVTPSDGRLVGRTASAAGQLPGSR